MQLVHIGSTGLLSGRTPAVKAVVMFSIAARFQVPIRVGCTPYFLDSSASKRGETDVRLVGALAGILALGTIKNAAPEGGGTFLLVAGVGFEPTTFRL